jgi:hypothetical protein
MQLNRNTTGDYKNDRAFIGQDLDTIMRTINQQAQLITTLQSTLTAVQAQLAVSNIAVAANGQVSGLSASRNMQTIAHDGSLSGLGTPASPLRVASSSATAAGLLVESTLLTNAQIAAASTVAMTILAGTSGQVIIPVFLSLNWHVVNPYSNSPSWRWGYTGSGGNFFASLTPGLTVGGTFYSTNAASAYNAVSTTSLYSGKGVEITLNIAPTPIVSPASSVNAVVTLAYYLATVVL